MCEKDFYENNSFIGGQGHFAPDNEESARDQDREVEEKIEVGSAHGPKRAPGEGAARGHKGRHPAQRFYIFPAEAFYRVAGKTKEDIWTNTPVGPFRLPRVSEASKVSLRVAASVAHRKQVRAQRAKH